MSRDEIKKVKKKFFSVINHTWDFLGHPCMPLKMDRIFSHDFSKVHSRPPPPVAPATAPRAHGAGFIYYDPIMEGK